MSITWILVANASQAHLYQGIKSKLVNGSAELSLVEHFDHPESREKRADLVSDRLGHSGRGTFVESSNPKQHEAEQFAKQLVDMLDQGRKQHDFDEFIIAAPPKFNGLLHQHIRHNQQLNHLLSLSINKDYTRDDSQHLISHLQEHL